MATDPLLNLSGPAKPLKAEPPDAAESAGLLRTGRARLHDAANPVLSLESRFDLAYNAAHALCLATSATPTSAPQHLTTGDHRASPAPQTPPPKGSSRQPHHPDALLHDPHNPGSPSPYDPGADRHTPIRQLQQL